MRTSLVLIALLLILAVPAAAQSTIRVAGGDVSLPRRSRVNPSRLTRRVPRLDSAQLARICVSGDSAQRLALVDFGSRARVTRVEFDSADARMFWDVHVVPDRHEDTIVRYRVDALSGGIMDIREYAAARALDARTKP